MSIFNRAVKRVFDILATGIGIIILSPILLIIALRIKTGSDGPVFFKQLNLQIAPGLPGVQDALHGFVHGYCTSVFAIILQIVLFLK